MSAAVFGDSLISPLPRQCPQGPPEHPTELCWQSCVRGEGSALNSQPTGRGASAHFLWLCCAHTYVPFAGTKPAHTPRWSQRERAESVVAK